MEDSSVQLDRDLDQVPEELGDTLLVVVGVEGEPYLLGRAPSV